MAKTYEEALKVVEDYETKLRKQGALEVDTKVKFKIDTLKDFITDFLYKNQMDTCFDKTNRVGGNLVSNSTNYNKDSSYRGARRSISDLFRLSLNYMGDKIKLLDVMEVMYEVCNNYTFPNGYICYNSICSSVHRRVFNLGSGNASYRLNSNSSSSIQYNGDDEASIHIADYITLCDPANKAKRQREQETLQKVEREKVIKKTYNDIDKLVEEKIKKLISDTNSESKRSLVKQIRTLKANKKKISA